MSDKTPVKVYSKSEGKCCRLCSQSKDLDRSTNIFSQAGKRKELSRKVSDVFNINVEEGDGFPASICRNCETKLFKLYEFKVVVLDTQARLRHDLKIKRCKAISPSEEPKQKAPTIEERSTAKGRSLFPATKSAEQSETSSNTHTKSQVGLSSGIRKTTTSNNKAYKEDRDTYEVLRSDCPLDNDLVSKLFNALKTRLPSVIVSTMWNITSLKEQMKAKLLQQLDMDCTELCTKKNASLLRQKDFHNMVNLDWDKILNEMSSRCTTLYDVMTTVVKKQNLKGSVPPICLCYGILLQQRNHELSLIQRINTVLLSEGGAKKQLINRCQKLGFSLSHSRKLVLLDIIGGHFADKVIEQVKQGKRLQGTGDNWDLRVHPHDLRKDHQNEDLHYFASSLIVERVPCLGLSNVSPQREIKTLPNSAFLLNDEETSKLREDFKVLVGRVIVSHIPSLSFMKTVIPNHIEHRYQKEMSQQSTIVPLTMQLKDEKHYDDVVDILCEYENTIENIYEQAGVVQLPPNTRPAQTHGSLQDSHSSPDQPGGHLNKSDENDHMKGISVPFGGDQMTRVRFAGAKDLRRGCHTAKDRFDHVSPFSVEFFHTKMSFLQLVFNHLHKPQSVREVGTLKYFRERLNRKNVTPDKVTKSYEGCEQFIISTGKAYLLEAAMEFWGMNSMEDKPTKHCPPHGILHLPLTKKKEYFDEVIGAFVDEFVMVDPDHEEILQFKEAEKQARVVQNIEAEHDYASVPVEIPEGFTNTEEETPLQAVDRVRYYGLNLLELAVFLMQLMDTCAEGDGDRNNINKKRLLLYFKRFSSFSKYALEMFVSIAQIKALQSEEMAHRLTWGRYVNWNGGQGKNIECDCAQEICNRTCKSVVKGIGANKTTKAMIRASKAAAGIQQIVSLFDKTTKIHKVSQSHSTRSSVGDEMLMFQDLRKLRPFQIKPNRTHHSFNKIEMSSLTGLDMGDLFTWLNKHKEQISMGV